MTVVKKTHAPIGTIGLLTGAFFALVAIVFIAWGIKDIRAGEGTGPLFFLGWVIFIALLMVYGFRRKKAADVADVEARTATGMAAGYDKRETPRGGTDVRPIAFLWLQDTALGTPMLEDGDASKLLIFLVILAIIGAIWYFVARSKKAP
jgi:hypothetical protein